MPIIIINIIIACIYHYVQYIVVGVVVQKVNGHQWQCSIKNGKRISFFSFEHIFFLLFQHLIYNNPSSLKRQRKNQFFYLFLFLDPARGLLLNWTIYTAFLYMGTKMKGICKGFNNFFSQIFVVKEREIEIGYPTDVKHVAHIGWDGAAGAAPTWMNEFKTGPDFAATSIGNSGSALSPWSSQDFDSSSMGHQSTASLCKDISSSDLPNIPKAKQRRKKSKSTSSPRSTSSSTSKTSRAMKSKAKYVEGNVKPANIEVA